MTTGSAFILLGALGVGVGIFVKNLDFRAGGIMRADSGEGSKVPTWLARAGFFVAGWCFIHEGFQIVQR
jgi:hypothetical protein